MKDKIIRRPDFAGGGITSEELARMKIHAEKWTDIAFRTEPAEFDTLARAIRGVYAAASLPAPRVILVPSPFVMAIASGIASAVWYIRKGADRATAIDDATHAATHAATYAAIDAATYAATDAATYAATHAATDAATYAAIDAATYAATHAATYAATRAATHAATYAATDTATRDATYAAIDAASAATHAATDAATYAATDAATYAATDTATRAATHAATYAATDTATRDATYAAIDDAERATRDATDATTYAATDAATYAAIDAATYAATHAATDTATRAATHAATYAATDTATHAVNSWLVNVILEFLPSSDLKFTLRCIANVMKIFHGGNMWASWECYLTATRDILGLRLKPYRKYKFWEDAARNGGFRIMHDEFCMISDFPEFIKIDAENRPHCADGPSHRWRDGWSLWHWHGVPVPSNWIEKKMTAQEVLAEPNTEKRRAGAEILGWGEILRTMEAKSIDKDADPEIGELIEVKLPGADKARFLRVHCPTGRDFALSVPMEMKTALEANAWTYGLTTHEFKPEGRT